MGRPETEIAWGGAVAELALTLREIRNKAGRPPYRVLADAKPAMYSVSVLTAAAGGRLCPTWEVTEAYVLACGGDPADVRPQWEKAHNSSSRTSRARQPKKPEPGRKPPVPGPRDRQQVIRQPDPRQAVTARDFVHQLRALRVWAGKPGPAEIAAAAHDLGRKRIADSTLYDALNPKRTTLPKVGIVQIVVHACRGDVGQWTQAWRAIAMLELETGNPPQPQADGPPGSGGETAHITAAADEVAGPAALFAAPSAERTLRIVRDGRK